MDAPEENGTKIPSWETKFAEIEEMVAKLAQQRDSALNLLEHVQRELALALLRIEELQGEEKRTDDEEANRYA